MQSLNYLHPSNQIKTWSSAILFSDDFILKGQFTQIIKTNSHFLLWYLAIMIHLCYLFCYTNEMNFCCGAYRILDFYLLITNTKNHAFQCPD